VSLCVCIKCQNFSRVTIIIHTYIILTFLDISPNCRYRSTFFNGLCIPLLLTPCKLVTYGPSSSIDVLGRVHTGGPFLFIGFGMTKLVLALCHLPETIFRTAYGVGAEPSVAGSTDAQSRVRCDGEVAVVVVAWPRLRIAMGVAAARGGRGLGVRFGRLMILFRSVPHELELLRAVDDAATWRAARRLRRLDNTTSLDIIISIM